MIVIPGSALLHHTYVPHRHQVGRNSLWIAVHKTNASVIYAKTIDHEMRLRERERVEEQDIRSGKTSADIARFVDYQNRVAEVALEVLESFAKQKRLSNKIKEVQQKEKKALAVVPVSMLTFVHLDLTKASVEHLAR